MSSKMMLQLLMLMLLQLLTPSSSTPISNSDVRGGGCCGPDQWEALLTYSLSGLGPYTEVDSSVAFDFTNQLVAVNQTLQGDGGATVAQRILVNGKLAKTFVEYVGTGYCQVMPTGSVQRTCVPDYFVPVAKFYMGLPSERLDLVSYYAYVQNLNVTLVATGRSCMPVFESVQGNGISETIFIANVVPGISDPSVFVVPPACQNLTKMADSKMADSKMADSQMADAERKLRFRRWSFDVRGGRPSFAMAAADLPAN